MDASEPQLNWRIQNAKRAWYLLPDGSVREEIDVDLEVLCWRSLPEALADPSFDYTGYFGPGNVEFPVIRLNREEWLLHGTLLHSLTDEACEGISQQLAESAEDLARDAGDSWLHAVFPERLLKRIDLPLAIKLRNVYPHVRRQLSGTTAYAPRTIAEELLITWTMSELKDTWDDMAEDYRRHLDSEEVDDVSAQIDLLSVSLTDNFDCHFLYDDALDGLDADPVISATMAVRSLAIEDWFEPFQ